MARAGAPGRLRSPRRPPAAVVTPLPNNGVGSGWVERRYGNLYDGIDLNRAAVSKTNLFGDRNLGNIFYTNMTTANALPWDATFIVMHPYARTNICRLPFALGTEGAMSDAITGGGSTEKVMQLLIENYEYSRAPIVKAFEEWSHVAIATVYIGGNAKFRLPVREFLDVAAFGPLNEKVARISNEMADELPNGKAQLIANGKWPRGLSAPIIIPVRQDFRVAIDCEFNTHERLCAELDRLRDPILPNPMLWFHLEGFLTMRVQQ